MKAISGSALDWYEQRNVQFMGYCKNFDKPSVSFVKQRRVCLFRHFLYIYILYLTSLYRFPQYLVTHERTVRRFLLWYYIIDYWFISITILRCGECCNFLTIVVCQVGFSLLTLCSRAFLSIQVHITIGSNVYDNRTIKSDVSQSLFVG